MPAVQEAKRPRMTAQEATSFQRYSKANALAAMVWLRESGACKGECSAYQDIYTYNRWQAQGYQVRKGQHGAKITTMIETMKKDQDGKEEIDKRPWNTTVFCRCQVDKIGANVVQYAGAAAR